MSTIFILLAFGSLIALLVGLIKPSVFKNKRWENPTRKRIGLIFGGATLLFLVLTGTTTPSSTSSSQANPTSTPIPKQETQATPQASSTPTLTPIVFDSSKGNNPYAANYAEKILSSFGQKIPGFIKDAYVRLDPEDMAGKSDDDYAKSLTFGTLSLVVNADSWDGMTDSLKKDFVAGIITVTKSNIRIYPHVTVSDGFRTVAEGSWDLWNGEASIILK